MSQTLVEVIVVCGVFGLFTGAIGYHKNPTVASFIVFFIAGAVLPVVGLLVAAISKPRDAPPPMPKPGVPAGWYPDPHRQAAQRWWDGSQWTSHEA